MTNNLDTMQHHHPSRVIEHASSTVPRAGASKPRLAGPARWQPAAVLGVALLMSSCASLSVKRDTATSGTFNSSARSFTILSYSLPRPSIQIAHENIADAGLPNTHATSVTHTDWGWFDWVLEIISVRSARVKGTWGFNGESLGLDPSAAADSE